MKEMLLGSDRMKVVLLLAVVLVSSVGCETIEHRRLAREAKHYEYPDGYQKEKSFWSSGKRLEPSYAPDPWTKRKEVYWLP